MVVSGRELLLRRVQGRLEFAPVGDQWLRMRVRQAGSFFAR